MKTVVLLLAALLATPIPLLAVESFYEPLPKMKYPADNPWSQVKEDLGKALFFDPRLSGSNWISCATCHNPALGWSDALPRALGNGQKELGRHSPSIINSGYFTAQFWDGRAKTLEEQALGPIQAAGEMNQKLGPLIKELKAIPGYVLLFEKAFGASGIDAKNIARAIATFERSVVSKNSPYDRYWAGDKSAMSPAATRGMNLFFGKAKCNNCHKGPAFTDSDFHHIRDIQKGPLQEDAGRFNVTKDENDRGNFKTPGLRDVSSAAPYMHDGSIATLKGVVDFYNLGGYGLMNLNGKEKADLLAFLLALEGEPIRVVLPLLP